MAAVGPGGARRVADVIVALIGLILAAPGMLLIAVALRIDTQGPIIYSQMRIGRGGRPFRLYKFRKFWHRQESNGRGITLKNDPRMTRVGRVIEQTKLDELPQLWNVLVGDMAIVGPRPETMEFDDCFAGSMQELLDYTPGLFGPNQVIFRNESSLYPDEIDPHEYYRSVLFPAKAQVDLAYFPHRSSASDAGWVLSGVLGRPVFSSAMLRKLPQTALVPVAASAERNRDVKPDMELGRAAGL